VLLVLQQIGTQVVSQTLSLKRLKIRISGQNFLKNGLTQSFLYRKLAQISLTHQRENISQLNNPQG